MAKLISMMNTSLDGYTEDEHGRFDWTAPHDEEVHTWIFTHVSSFRTCLYGRRVYETMLYWETAHTIPGQPQFVLDFAAQWQAAEKFVYSRTLDEPRSTHTRIERAFDPDAVRKLKADTEHPIVVAGPELAAQAIQAGLVDELQMRVCPLVIGGENDISRVACGWIWRWSRSGGSVTGKSFCGMRSAVRRCEEMEMSRVSRELVIDRQRSI